MKKVLFITKMFIIKSKGLMKKLFEIVNVL